MASADGAEASRRLPIARAGTVSSSPVVQEARMPKRLERSERYSPPSPASTPSRSACGSPRAVTSYGGESGRKSTRTADPAVRMALVALRRCPLIEIASAPAAHRAFTAICRSPSVTRLTVPSATPGLAGSGTESWSESTTPVPSRDDAALSPSSACRCSASFASAPSSTTAWASAISPSRVSWRASSSSISARASSTSCSSSARGLSSAAASRRSSVTATATVKPSTSASSTVTVRVIRLSGGVSSAGVGSCRLRASTS